jgi:hypothetical protein
MPSFIATLLRVLALVLTILLGTLPLLISAILGLAIRQRRIAYGLALGLTVGLILLVQDADAVLRWGAWGWRLHHRLLIDGVPPLWGDLALNLAWAMLGVKIGRAAREGYLDARSGQRGQRNGFP